MILPFVLDFLFPPSCVSCGRITNNFILKNETNKWICNKCYERVIKYKNGQILKVRNIDYDKFVYLFEYRHIIRKIIIAYKFHSLPYISNFFIDEILKNKNLCGFLKNYDIIVPVPMSRIKKNIRGYNQTELIAKNIASSLDIKMKKIIKKRENIETQSKLLKTARRRNIRGAFYCTKRISEQNVILFDDIFTTGATIKECAKILKMNGAKKILVLVLAKD